ncbi:MAG: hypothetical protein H6751_14010 [Candidatus Omnitrophica bacterium]|nr:hypothetical protein [Candidatus Omnitrophota bacterium]MCB9768734.1 hypothetical protein [Candidatus Omnitrophota bacterium]MCB9784074.1 hypothetical protein [Candidatus Omnitrophota bacterium]
MKIRPFLLLSLLGLGMTAQFSLAQSSEDIFNATELLCVIEALQSDDLDHPDGSIICDEGNVGGELFFLGDHWFEAILDLPGCDCDFDLDGLTGCEEVLLCTFPGINDSDGDCLSDGLEIEMGLDPRNSDTDGNGTPDGDEDADGDEILNRDEDFDQDALTNCQEAMLGINPMDGDSDGDGFPDGGEVDVETGVPISDPADPNDRPPIFVASAPPVQTVLVRSDGADAGGLSYNTFVSAPPVNAIIGSTQSGTGGISINTVVTNPPTSVIVASSQSDIPLSLNTTVSSPPASVIVTSSEEAIDPGSLNTVVTQPPVEVEIPVDEMK